MPFLALHDILTAWHGGDITTKRAMSLAQIETTAELQEAAMNSGVLPMRPPSPEQQAHFDLVDRILASVRIGSTAKPD